MAKELLREESEMPKVWFIGLIYYSLHYDMSLSQPWTRVFYYKDLFGYHNLADKRKGYYLNDFDVPGLVTKLPHAVLQRVQDAEYTTQVLYNQRKVDCKTMDALSTKQVKANSNKDYPETVLENKYLLEKYVQLLVDRGIQPVFTLIPFPSVYPIGEKLFSELLNISKLLRINMAVRP